MILPDVNVLLYAFREAAPDHGAYRAWLERTVASDDAFALSEFVLSSVVRIATHPRVFSPPSRVESAFEFCDALRGQPNAVMVSPGPRHWLIFSHMCRVTDASGSGVTRAYVAALAVEHGCQLTSSDPHYRRLLGPRWRHPLG